MTIIGQGAEAIVVRKGKTVLKERIAKTYRHPTLDLTLRKSRTRREATILEKLAKLDFPSVRLIAMDDKSMTLTLEHVAGKKVRDVLTLKNLKLCREIGEDVGILHSHNIIHGDLTTSNMMLADKIILIDFGLSFVSHKPEDKAVDLHLLKHALESAHHALYEAALKEVILGYKKGNPSWNEVFTRLETVEKRGRNKK